MCVDRIPLIKFNALLDATFISPFPDYKIKIYRYLINPKAQIQREKCAGNAKFSIISEAFHKQEKQTYFKRMSLGNYKASIKEPNLKHVAFPLQLPLMFMEVKQHHAQRVALLWKTSYSSTFFFKALQQLLYICTGLKRNSVI